MFVNYWKSDERESGINLAFARVALAGYALWKLFSYEWAGVKQWPFFLFERSPQSHLVPSPTYLDYLYLEVGIATVLLVCVMFGYRLRLTGFLSALFLAHLSGVHYSVTNSSSTFLPVVYLLLFFALFSETDVISVDAIRRTRTRSLESLHAFLKSDRPTKYPTPVLKWMLLTVGGIYFFTGWGKVKFGVLHWATGENLARTIHMDTFRYLRDVPALGQVLIDNTLLATISAWASVLLELSLVFAILGGITLWPFVVGLLGMHVLIALAMNIFFFDQFLLFALFLPWDRWYQRRSSDNSLVVGYDEHCYFCARSLYTIKQLDVNGGLHFYTQSDLPAEFARRDEVDLNDAMVVFDGETPYRGYHAFKRILRHFAGFRLLAAVMDLKPVTYVGERVYRYIADNRNRYFTCSIEE